MIRLFFVIVFLIFQGKEIPSVDFYPEKSALKILKKELKSEELQIVGSYDLTEKLQSGRHIVVYSLKSENRDYYAVFSESKGRYDMFDYVVVTDKEGTVSQVKILRYRSEHGGEIASKKWLEQFVGFQGGQLQYEKDISAISGATLSAQSITRDIPALISLLQDSIINMNQK